VIRKRLKKKFGRVGDFAFREGTRFEISDCRFNRFICEYKKDPLNKFDLSPTKSAQLNLGESPQISKVSEAVNTFPHEPRRHSYQFC